MKHYDALRSVPKDALKTIEFGNLKGKSDINPQWRYEAMTKEEQAKRKKLQIERDIAILTAIFFAVRR